MRKAEINRKTNETDIKLLLDLDGTGASDIKSGSGFLDHMLELFAKHGSFDLTVNCVGDTKVDMHHSVEDIGISLGQAFKTALGDKKGITRYGCMCLPMDEALLQVAVDISGRSLFRFDVKFPDEYKVGDLDTELIEEFLLGFVRNAELTLHVAKMSGSNIHHIVEAIFKALGRVLRQAVSIDIRNKGVLPSTKGVL